ncbi:MAG TPA: YidC/Oxa1 family membrane protein insertase [Acidimicrobiales bacterium]|nr:YidC/Oxa1 family membrane protein insertase [Acidimicrobiales bacterium]
MLDSLFELISSLLSAIYSVVPNYAIAIALLTCVAMVITTPLTLKSTRSMIEMQRLQPQIRKLQAQYKDDRQKLNEEMMSFYRENEINPVGGCLPMLIQMPVFSILYWVVRGLTNQARWGGFQDVLVGHGMDPDINRGFDPKYLNHSSDLYNSLLGKTHMSSFGVDLAISPSQALQEGFLTALPYLLALAVIAVLAWYQQRQIMGRNKHTEVTDQQKMMMRIGPAFQIFFAFVSPAAVGIYFLVSTSWRVAQQYYITQTLYGGEDSAGVQAQKAMAEARAERKKQGASNGAARAKGAGGQRGAAKEAKSGVASSSSNGARSTASDKDSTGSKAQTTTSGAARSGSPQPRSRKKRKRK